MLIVVGLSHRRAPLTLRERCAVTVEQRERALADLRARLGHAVLLSTCGRTELYIDHPDAGEAEREAIGWLARRAGIEPGDLAHYAECECGELAVLRAVRVACGLESALVGENEILGQVRRAWLDAAAAGSLSPQLDAAFRLAVRTGRQARRTGGDHGWPSRPSWPSRAHAEGTALPSSDTVAGCAHAEGTSVASPDTVAGWTSLAESAAAEVGDALEHLAAPLVLIAGSGPMGQHTARKLRERFGSRLAIELAGRTPARVLAHAAQLDARPLALSEIPAALDRADAAVFGLRTSRPLIAAAQIAPRPADRPLLIVDLSVPRAVDEAVGRLPGVLLHDVDELGAGAGGYGRWDAEGLAKVEQLACRAAAEFAAGDLPATATLAALRLQADGIRRAQLARTLRRLPGLDGETAEAIDAMSRAIVNRLLHEPTLRLKSDQNGDLARQVGELFGVDLTPSPLRG